jgi:MoxR-like ATPase
VGIDALTGEVDRIRQILTGGAALGDVQLFSQLKALGEIKTALASLPDPRARELEARVAQLLEASFRSGRFSQI